MKTLDEALHMVFVRRRRNALYSFLLRQEGWTSLFDTAYNIREHSPDYGWLSNFHNSHIRRMITADIEAINNDPQYQRIIISSRRGVKIADRDEFERWVRAEYAEIFSKLGRVRYLVKKAGLDGQYDLFEEEIHASFAEV